MLRAAILVIVLLIVLSFFGISIENVVHSPTGQANFSYVGDLLQQGWDQLVSFVNSMSGSIHHLF